MKYKNLSAIPDRGMRYIEVPFDKSYIFYEDGVMYSRKSGVFLTPYYNTRTKHKKTYLLQKGCKTYFCTWNIENNIRKYFLDNPPKIEGVKWKDMLRYEGEYVIYQNGQVWSLKQCKWMTACKNKGGYLLFCLCKDNKRKTEYLHRLLAENFIANTTLQNMQVHHQSKQVENNSLENLVIMTHEEHMSLHPKNVKRKHSAQFLAKKAEKDRVKMLEKELKDAIRQKTGKRVYKHTKKFLEKQEQKRLNKLEGKK